MIAYNEEASIEPVTIELAGALVAHGLDAEILLVDDGSSDTTPARMQALAAAQPNVRLTRLARNTGIGGALRAGFDAARGEWLTWIPGDGQIPPEAVIALWQGRALAPMGMTTTVYERRPDPWYRHAISWTFNALIRARTGEPTPSGGNYLLRRELWVAAALPPDDTMMLSTALRTRVREMGHPIATRSIPCRPRLAGTSKVLNPRTIGRTLRAMLALRRPRRPPAGEA